MKKLLFVSLLSLSSFAFAEYYKVYVTRLDNNMYRTSDGFYIATKYCYEYATSEEAILVYEQYSYDNKLIFNSGTSCDVDKVFK